MTSHKHATAMLQYADDALETEEPWLRWEMSDDGAYWTECSEHPRWEDLMQYRRRLKTIMINGFEVPEPLRVAPPEGTKVYLVNTARGAIHNFQWVAQDAESLDNKRLRWGLLHLTSKAAETHLMALLSFTQEPTK